MLDIKLIRENPKLVKENLKKRKDNEKLKWLDSLVKYDQEWREAKQEIEQWCHQRNIITHEIAELKKKGHDAAKKIKEAAEFPQKIKDQEIKIFELKEKIDFYLLRIPNLLHDSVPYGKDDSENVEIKKVGKIQKFNFSLQSHEQIAERLGIIDFDKAVEIAGHGFYYLKGDLVRLNLALMQFALDTLTKKGYTPIEPPFMLRKKPYEGVTDLADFEKVMYKIENEDLYLIATSEHPIAALYSNEVIDDAQLPLKYVGMSPCFRKEVGAHGIDTKGIFRVHQFFKIEQFIFCKQEESWKYHEELIQNAEEIFKGLGIPYRMVNICTGDIGTIAAKKYDLEAWSPRQKKYIEVVSCSNCTDYQARRLNIRYGKEGGEKRLIHTLNSTALANTRTLVCILENYQQPDGSVSIPSILRPYMNGQQKLEVKKNENHGRKQTKEKKTV